MASQILTVYRRIAAKTVTLSTGQPVISWVFDNLKGAVSSADCPIRMLMPANKTKQGGSAEFRNPNGLACITWTITDQMLYAPYASGRGLADYAEPLTDYCGAYDTIVRELRSELGRELNGIVINNWSIYPDTIQYPQYGSQVWFGVVASITVEEFTDG